MAYAGLFIGNLSCCILYILYFINKFADKTVEFKDGKVTTYLGNYEDYKRSKEKTKQESFLDRVKVNAKQSDKETNTSNNKKKDKRNDRDDDWER